MQPMRGLLVLLCAAAASVASCQSVLASLFHSSLKEEKIGLQEQLVRLHTLLQKLVDLPQAHPELQHPEALQVVQLCIEAAAQHHRRQTLAGNPSGFFQPLRQTRNGVLQDVDKGLRALAAKQLSSSFPAVRRAVMALLLRTVTTSESGVGAEEGPVIDSILRSLYTIHRQGVSARGMMEHLHVSKAAGSTVCQLGEKNKCKTKIFKPNSGKGNCLIIEFHDMPRWIAPDQHARHSFPEKTYPYVRFGQWRAVNVTCEDRYATMAKNGWNVYSNEYTVVGSTQGNAGASAAQGQAVPLPVGLCPQFVYILVFRDPAVRLLSHVRYIIQQYQSKYKSQGKRVLAKLAQLSDQDWLEFAPAAMDNYYIRSLLGEAVFNMPANSITEEHLHRAEPVLLSVDILLDSARPEVDAYNLHMGLGWPYGFEHVHEKKQTGSGGRSLEAAAKTQPLPPHLKNMFLNNKWDQALYHLSHFLATLDSVLFHYAASGGFADVPSPENATATSCGYLGKPQRQKQQQQSGAGLATEAMAV